MPEPQLLGSSLPLEPHEGLATVAVTSEWESAQLVTDPLPRTIARVALPAVASSLLMTLFFSVDTFWIGTRVGSAGSPPRPPRCSGSGCSSRSPRW